jgi:hypothetical protein
LLKEPFQFGNRVDLGIPFLIMHQGKQGISQGLGPLAGSALAALCPRSLGRPHTSVTF